MRYATKTLRWGLPALLLLILALLGAAWGYLRASLPQLDGERPLSGLAAAATVERDAQGAVTIRAANRRDLARATGFVHAQDRFFQMDLLRRSAAGELAALVGPAALPVDRRARLHGMRRVAEQVLAGLPGEQRALLQAYAEGANAGLRALEASPFEYLLLGADPSPWRAEDALLVVHAMYFDLQDARAERDAQLGVLQAALPPALFEFLNAPGSDWDAAIDGSRVQMPALPGPEVYDLRELELPQPAVTADAETLRDDPAVGSNSWAVAAAASADGAAWLANDMHLGLRVPNTWYRLRLEWTQDGRERAVTGVSLPGAPAVVVGSNGAVAWGFTNSYGDWSDRVLLELDPEDPERYLSRDGYQPFGHRVEIIEVKGEAAEELVVRETRWGPVVGEDALGRPQALRWIAHDPEATNLGLLGLETAEDLESALAVANGAGVPAQNILVADREGRIGWSIIGRLPRREGCDGRLPQDWRNQPCWDGWLDVADYPRLLDPADDRLWTANNRVVGGERQALIGDGGMALGARAAQIRDGLRARPRLTPADLMAVQLDDRAVFLDRWQQHLLELLDEQAMAEDPRRRELRRLVAEWGGRALPDSVGYRLVRGFRLYLMQDVLGALTAEARALDPQLRPDALHQAEAALWRLVRERPAHLLDPAFPDWRAQELAAVDQLLDQLWEPEHGLARATWGERNRLRMSHPLTQAVPVLGYWLDMPSAPLPGDAHMPRVQGPSHGASERLVVAPGREDQSLLHLPGGQSGHPLSPYYRAGHDDWVEGRGTPLLPGPARHRLRLLPQAPG